MYKIRRLASTALIVSAASLFVVEDSSAWWNSDRGWGGNRWYDYDRYYGGPYGYGGPWGGPYGGYGWGGGPWGYPGGYYGRPSTIVVNPPSKSEDKSQQRLPE